MKINAIVLTLVAIMAFGCRSDRSADAQSLEHAVRAMLTARGYFEQRRPGPLDEVEAYVWEKAGVRVFLQRDDAGRPAVLVGSFSKTSFQESEDMRIELLRLAGAYPDVRVARVLTPQTVELK
jgi:hypothetical protein